MPSGGVHPIGFGEKRQEPLSSPSASNEPYAAGRNSIDKVDLGAQHWCSIGPRHSENWIALNAMATDHMPIEVSFRDTVSNFLAALARLSGPRRWPGQRIDGAAADSTRPPDPPEITPQP